MTSEVVVMNRMGIALAADSVVTMFDDNGIHKKRLDSVAKLFMLSECHPVGIMVYNNASLVGVPWETIIKLFRASLKDKNFPHLECFGRELIKFLNTNRDLFPEVVQKKYYGVEFKAECRRIQEFTQKLYDYIVQSPSGCAGEDTRALVIAYTIQERLNKWEEQDDADGFSDEQTTNFLDKMSGEVNKIAMEVFASWPAGNEEIMQLNKIARHLISKKALNIEASTGLVIGGFGQKEHFPVVQHIIVNGMYGDVLKFEEAGIRQISEESPSYVEPFADTGAVDCFLFGVNDKIGNEITKTVDLLRQRLVEALETITGIGVKEIIILIKEINLRSNQEASGLSERIKYLKAKRFSDIVDVVEVLPLKELAKVASMLVRLSSFEKQLSLEAETVGEPIDVAVISKGDGFIWIDRKHYFKPELNHRFFTN